MPNQIDISSPRRLALVVDDDEETRLLIRMVLENDGWAVEEAEDGASACLAVPRLHPDIVLLDVAMPHLDGFEACARLRSLPEGELLPILMITGSDDQASVSRAYEVGATDFLAKPFNLTLLSQRLRYMYRTKQGSAALQNERDFVSMIVGTSSALVVVLDPSGRIVRFNPSCERMSGYSASEAEGKFIWDILSEADGRDQERLLFEQLTAGRQTSDYEGFWTTKGGARKAIAWSNSVFVNRDGSVENVVCTGLDVTDRNHAEERIRFLASYDPLTGLPNRRLITERLQQAIAAGDTNGQRLAVVFIDLDRFKNFNTTLGHRRGDLVLGEMAERMRRSLRLSDVLSRQAPDLRMELGRLGGDEFAVLLPGIPNASAVAAIIERLQNALTRPIRFDDQEYSMTASIGASLYPDDGRDAECLLSNAEAAMCGAREKRRGHYRFYSASTHTSVSTRLTLATELRQGIEREELVVHYQPKVLCDTGTICGAEALVRWLHPSRGLMAPDTFIDIAEETGLIVPLGDWVLSEACRQVTRWLEAGFRAVPVAVNLSATQFRVEDLLARIGSVLNRTGIDPEYLSFEVTESTVMRNAHDARDVLRCLNELGVKVSIDDFGTGYSSLSSLKSLPFHSLKIDRVFVKDLAEGSSDAAITQAIITMAHGLGLTVVAEGVELQSELDILVAQDCDEIQGYLVSPAVPAEQFAAMLDDGDRINATGLLNVGSGTGLDVCEP